MSGSVFALDLDIRGGSEQVIELVVDWSEPFLAGILGGEEYDGFLLFEKFLFFILLLSVVYIALKQITIFEDNPAVIWTVAIIIPLLAVRFMDFVWLNTIILSYAVLGIALGGILPFIIYMFFLHGVFEESSGGRKIGWIFFIIVYFGLWSTSEEVTYAWIYFVTMGVSLVFLLFDGTIHRVFEKQRWKESRNSSLYDVINEKNRQIKRYREDREMPENIRNKQIRKLEREKKKLQKELGKF